MDVQPEGLAAVGPDLSGHERRRPVHGAPDPGLRVTATLIQDFQLEKIAQLLPLSRVLLGDECLVREVKRFWGARPPTSFSALDEVLAFVEHLRGRLRVGLRVNYLEDALAYEAALLELRSPRPEPRGPFSIEVRFRYDLGPLFTALAAGRKPGRVRRRPCLLWATLGDDGDVEWSGAGAGAAPIPGRRQTLTPKPFAAPESSASRNAASA